MQAKLYFVHALTPLHAGTGQGVGVIDLPIAREKATGIPYLPGSSVKGVLRDASQSTDKSTGKTQTLAVFGPETENASEYAGALQVADARLLALPVRSLLGTFAWVTSPLLLRRFQRDGQFAAGAVALPTTVPAPASVWECLVHSDACALIEKQGEQRMVYLEDLDLQAKGDAGAKAWAEAIAASVLGKDTEWGKLFQERFCVVHDDVLGFLLETATEVVARIKIQDDTKTVERGGLWYEEALPAESILVGIFAAQGVQKSGAKPDAAFTHLATLLKQPLQFGGNATVGRGICRVYTDAKV